MSEVLKLSSTDVKAWLERETGSILNPVHTKAQRQLDEMHKVLESLSEVSKTLLDNSGKEIEKRNMKTYGRARAMNKLPAFLSTGSGKSKCPTKPRMTA